MSKQSEAKEAQGYVDKAIPQTCSNCKSYRSEIYEFPPDVYTLIVYTKESNIRCGIGGFKVKKTATCNQFEQKVTEWVI